MSTPNEGPSRASQEERLEPEKEPEPSSAAGPSRAASQEERPEPEPSSPAGPSRAASQEERPETEPEPSAAAVPPKPQPQPKRWLVLSAIPTLLRPVAAAHLPGAIAPLADERLHLLLLPGADLALDIQPAPRASIMVLSDRVAPDAHRRFGLHPYVHAADPSGCFLFNVTERADARDAFFLGSLLTRDVRRIPPARPPIPAVYKFRPRRGVGLIADPQNLGAYMVAQLEPSVSISTRYTTLLCYSTAMDSWIIKPLASAPEQERRWGAHGVLAHQGLLWWVDVAYGLLVCNPFLDRPHLRFVPLPPGAEISGDIVHRTLLDDRRFVKISQGKLRYVEIRGDSGVSNKPQAAAVDEPLENTTLCMWTLVDPYAQHPWILDYQVPLADIWSHDTYIAADLLPNVVPKLGLVHPYNHGVLCLFQGGVLFALEVRTRRVLACQECRVEDDSKLRFQSSPYIHALQLPADITGECFPTDECFGNGIHDTAKRFMPVGSLWSSGASILGIPLASITKEAGIQHCFTVPEIKYALKRPGDFQINLTGLESLDRAQQVQKIIKTSMKSGKRWSASNLSTVKLLEQLDQRLDKLIKWLPVLAENKIDKKKAKSKVLKQGRMIHKEGKILKNRVRPRIGKKVSKMINDLDASALHLSALIICKNAEKEKKSPVWFLPSQEVHEHGP